MPECWYEPAACKDDDYLYSICTSKKPYFMIYVYESIRAEYKKYIKDTEIKCNVLTRKSVKEAAEEGLIPDFIEKYEKYLPVSDGPCTMNRICHYVENIFDNYKIEQKAIHGDFDNSFMKNGVPVQSDTREKLLQLAERYCEEYHVFKRSASHTRREYRTESMWLKKKYRDLGKMICPDDRERLDIVLDLDFDNKFLWNCAGDLVINRLREINDNI